MGREGHGRGCMAVRARRVSPTIHEVTGKKKSSCGGPESPQLSELTKTELRKR